MNRRGFLTGTAAVVAAATALPVPGLPILIPMPTAVPFRAGLEYSEYNGVGIFTVADIERAKRFAMSARVRPFFDHYAVARHPGWLMMEEPDGHG